MSDADPKATTKAAPGEISGPTSSAATGPTSSAAGNGSVYFSVEGGLAGRMRTITISPDGSTVVEVSGRRTTGQLDRATGEAIVSQLDQSRLFDRDREYPAQGADLQRYEIRYAGATVVAYDTSIPDRLNPAIQLLEGTLRSS